MKERGWGGDFSRLEQYYMQKLINITQDSTQGNMSYIVWQEVVDNNVSLPKDTVIHVWKDGSKFQDELHRVTVVYFNVIAQRCQLISFQDYEAWIPDITIFSLVLELRQLRCRLGSVLHRRAVKLFGNGGTKAFSKIIL